MDISALTATTSTSATEEPLPEREASSEEMSDFLLLLTAQIENQDPLEPLDANQFIDQLATINALEQQIETNENLKEIIDILRSS